MAVNFAKIVRDYFSNDFLNQASYALGESDSGVSKAMTGLIPIALAGILRRVSYGDGANSIRRMAKNAAQHLSPSPGLTNLQNDTGHNIANSLFGGNRSKIEAAISQFSGIKNSSTSSLVALVFPEILGLLGKEIEANDLSATGVFNLVVSQRDNIMNVMPSGFSSLDSILGLELP